MTVAALFSSALWRAREGKLPVMELLAATNQLGEAGEPAYVRELYSTWIACNASDPLLYAVCFNYGVELSRTGDLAGARDVFKQAISINPDFYPPYINLGHALERLGLIGEAVTQWYTVAGKLSGVTPDNLGYKTSALKQIGRVLETVNYDVHAEDALRQGLELRAEQPDVVQHWVSLRQRQCKWPVIEPWANLTRYQLLDGISSLSLAAYTDDPLLQLANAYLYAKNDIGRPKVSFSNTHDRLRHNAGQRRKIGYLSSDLREHAIGFLTAELFGLHDRSNVEVFSYYCGVRSDDAVHQHAKDTTDHWVDITSLSDEQAGQRIVDDGIEILVDINGYTNMARSKMLAMRPAPIIANWLGFPGSMGSPFHNYIIADDFIIPEDSEMFYSEKVVRLPCYQPNDRKRAVAENTPSRAEAGLPDDALVYCCFNGPHKITSFTWARWMTILREVPGSVLWLLSGIESINARFKSLMTQHGIEPERLIFAPKLRNPEHLARYPLADLFLDTSPYGAHTTCSDALWMGVPIVTLVGRSFASRVCGSLIKSAGLEDMVCTTPEEFVRLAVELGHDRERLGDLRRRLAAGRDTCVLFDTPLLVAKLEELYAEMWEDFVADRVPRPDLTNLEIYNDIGIELDSDTTEMLAQPNYRELYLEKLAAYDDYQFLREDGRLWSGRRQQKRRKIAAPRSLRAL